MPIKTDYHAIPESIDELREQYVELAKNNMDMANKIERLEAELRLFRKKSFQPQSEIFPSGQKDMFQNLLDKLAQEYSSKNPEEKQVDFPGHKRTVKKDRSLNKNLERVDVDHDLDEA
jgi:predicted  nucleic acid-binding Zn-ribbon protein